MILMRWYFLSNGKNLHNKGRQLCTQWTQGDGSGIDRNGGHKGTANSCFANDVVLNTNDVTALP